MASIFVNLNSKLEHADVNVQGWFWQLKGYVEDVDWLQWDRSNKDVINVTGGTMGEDDILPVHFTRTFILLQRLAQASQNLEIKYRDSVGHDWIDYTPVKEYSEAEMVAEEVKIVNKSPERVWAENDLEKAKVYSQKARDLGLSADATREIIASMRKAKETLKELDAADTERKERIKKCWHQVKQ